MHDVSLVCSLWGFCHNAGQCMNKTQDRCVITQFQDEEKALCCFYYSYTNVQFQQYAIRLLITKITYSISNKITVLLQFREVAA